MCPDMGTKYDINTAAAAAVEKNGPFPLERFPELRLVDDPDPLVYRGAQ